MLQLAAAAVLVLFSLLVFMARGSVLADLAAVPVSSVVSGAASLRRKEKTLGLLGFSSSPQRRKERSEVPTLLQPLEAELGPGS